MSPNFDILRYTYQVTEFLMGFPMIPKLCPGVIPFRNYKTIKTTYRCDCCRNTFRENGLSKKDSAHTLKKIIHIVCWARSASRRSVTSVCKERPWNWNCRDYVFFYYCLDVLYKYLHVFSNYKTLESPYEVKINEHEHVLHTFAGTAIAALDCVDTCILCMWIHGIHAFRPVA